MPQYVIAPIDDSANDLWSVDCTLHHRTTSAPRCNLIYYMYVPTNFSQINIRGVDTVAARYTL